MCLDYKTVFQRVTWRLWYQLRKTRVNWYKNDEFVDEGYFSVSIFIWNYLNTLEEVGGGQQKFSSNYSVGGLFWLYLVIEDEFIKS